MLGIRFVLDKIWRIRRHIQSVLYVLRLGTILEDGRDRGGWTAKNRKKVDQPQQNAELRGHPVVSATCGATNIIKHLQRKLITKMKLCRCIKHKLWDCVSVWVCVAHWLSACPQDSKAQPLRFSFCLFIHPDLVQKTISEHVGIWAPLSATENMRPPLGVRKPQNVQANVTLHELQTQSQMPCGPFFDLI